MLINIQNASKEFKDGQETIQVLQNINLTVEKGASIAIVGASGCGKTTLLQAMAGLDTFTSGKAELCGHNLMNIKDSELAKVHNNYIGFVYQKSHLLPDFNLLENIALPLAINGDKEAHKKALAIINKLKLGDFMQYYPHQISGGMQQKIAIGRAIANKPKVIFADEPTGNLDIDSKNLVLDNLFTASYENEAALVIVTHDNMVAKKADIIINMSELNRANRV